MIEEFAKPVRFRVYRPNGEVLTQHHDANQMNAPDQPQFDGVLFSDGKVVIHWLTAAKSISIFDDMFDLLKIHGHPEYGTRIVAYEPFPRDMKIAMIADGFVVEYADQ